MKLDKYFNKSKIIELVVVATILNPYYKLNKLQNIGFTIAELSLAKKIFYTTFEKYNAVYGAHNIQSKGEYKSDDEDPLNLHTEVIGTPELEEGRILNEAECYLKAYYLRCKKFDPEKEKNPNPTYKEWWSGREAALYLVLALIARDYSVVLATSVPTESVFSIARLIITKLRNRLSSRTISLVMCLKSWGLLPSTMVEAEELESKEGQGVLNHKEDKEPIELGEEFKLQPKGAVDMVIV